MFDSCLVYTNTMDTDIETHEVIGNLTGNEDITLCSPKIPDNKNKLSKPKKKRLFWPKTNGFFEELKKDQSFFKKVVNFVAMSTSENISDFTKKMPIAALDIATDLYIIQGQHIYEVFRAFKGPSIVRQVCKSPLTCDPTNGKLDRRTDLSGLHLRVSTEYYEPYGMFHPNNLNLPPKGIFSEVFLEIQRALNFTFTLQK